MAGRMRRITKIVGLAVLGVLGVLQLVPYGRDHTNPPPVSEPAWDTPATRALAVRACFDCHSNETRWPWYSHVAPVSWLVQRDVDVGRRVMNFSEWNRPYEEAAESAETVLEGEMPPPGYALLHPSVRLSAEEKRALASGLTATLGSRTGEGDRD
jgi:hypothetical protein